MPFSTHPSTFRRVADASPCVIDTDSSSWAVQASQMLRQNMYARLRLPAHEVCLVREMYAAAKAAFSDGRSRRQLRIPDDMVDDLDSRNGFVDDPNREWLELHCSIPAEFDGPIENPAALRVLECAERVFSACRVRCQEVLCELTENDTSSALGKLIAQENRTQPPPAGARETCRGYSESMLRVYRYSSNFQLRQGDGHHDMGLLTLIPKGSYPGLQIQLDKNTSKNTSWRATWINIEEIMAEDEAILFGGMTLARLTNIPALFHRVDIHRQVRLSAPYFHRPSPRVLIPATPGHDAELVYHFSARTRAAHDDELTSGGAVRVAPRDQRDYERRLACEFRYVDRRKRHRDRHNDCDLHACRNRRGEVRDRRNSDQRDDYDRRVDRGQCDDRHRRERHFEEKSSRDGRRINVWEGSEPSYEGSRKACNQRMLFRDRDRGDRVRQDQRS